MRCAPLAAPDRCHSGKGSAGAGALRIDSSELKLGRLIASGAEAEVFRGLLWGQKAAVKVLKLVRDTGEEKEEGLIAQELMFETRILTKLSHPNVLGLIGYTMEPAQIVLEALNGTLYDLISSGSIESCDGRLLAPLCDVLSGCAYLHALAVPILHRDLKPPNVLFDERHKCKLCDFGTAFELRASDPRPTSWCGSALYVAPEVDREEPYGLEADVFSFGVLAVELFYMLTTGYNFYGEGEMSLFDEEGGLLQGLEILRGPLIADPPTRPDRPESCDNDEVWELLMRCCAASPELRPTFADAAKVLGDIRASAGGGALADWL